MKKKQKVSKNNPTCPDCGSKTTESIWKMPNVKQIFDCVKCKRAIMIPY